MPHIEASIDIAAARADVFQFCHDAASRPDWDEQVTYIELLTPTPIRRGTLFRVDAGQAGGSIFSWDAEYIDFQFPSGSKVKALDTAASSPFAAGSKMTWQFESVGGNTHFTWIWDYRPRGILATIADKLGGQASTHRAIKRSLVNLKTILEAE